MNTIKINVMTGACWTSYYTATTYHYNPDDVLSGTVYSMPHLDSSLVLD